MQFRAIRRGNFFGVDALHAMVAGDRFPLAAELESTDLNCFRSSWEICNASMAPRTGWAAKDIEVFGCNLWTAFVPSRMLGWKGSSRRPPSFVMAEAE